MRDVQPHFICVVPRFLEKIYAAVLQKVREFSWAKQKLYHWAVAIAQKHRIQTEHSLAAHAKFAVASKLVLKPLRRVIAPRLLMMPCGGAALDKEVADFCYNIGLPVLSGYGMTETTATITCQRLNQQVSGSCGHPLVDITVKIGEDSEILVKGHTVMKGYYQNATATAEVLEDGWLKTGDAGYIDQNGLLYITDRIKDLMKTSNGKYVAPQRVEGLLSRSPFIEQVAIIADARNYVSALIVPAFSALEAWAKEQGIHYQSTLDLVKNTDVQQQVERAIKSVQHELSRFEQVKRFTLLSQAFSIELGEMTPTLKLRRSVIYKKYHAQIASMYS